MSKSTPINQLPIGNNNNEPPNNVQSNNESELVSEILNEIESNRNQELGNLENNNPLVQPQTQNINEIHNNEQAIQQQAIQQQAMQEQSIQQQAMQEQAMREQAMQEQAMQEQAMQEQAIQPNINMQPTMEDSNQHMNRIGLSKTEKIINELKVIGIVSTIFILYSIPQINNLVLGLLPSRLANMSNITLVLLVVKGILAGITYYGVNRCLT